VGGPRVYPSAVLERGRDGSWVNQWEQKGGRKTSKEDEEKRYTLSHLRHQQQKMGKKKGPQGWEQGSPPLGEQKQSYLMRGYHEKGERTQKTKNIHTGLITQARKNPRERQHRANRKKEKKKEDMGPAFVLRHPKKIKT